MRKSDDITKASKSSPCESETERTTKQSEQTPGTVLSEVTLNIENIQDYDETRTVRKHNIHDLKVVSAKEQENIYQTSQIEIRHSHMDRRNLREVTPMPKKKDEEEHLKDEKKDSTIKATPMVDVNRSSSKQEKVRHKGDNQKSKENIIREECAQSDECQNCKNMQSEIKNLTARMRDLQNELKERFKTEKYIAENLSKKGKDKKSKKYPTESKEIFKDESRWKASYKELEGKINELRKEMVIQRDYYQKKIEENKNEIQRLEMELSKMDDEINTLEKTIEKVDRENSRYLSIIQDTRKNSGKKFETERKKIIQSMELNQLAKQELHRSNEAMVSRLQTMIRQTCDDNANLHVQLGKAEEIRKNLKFQTMEPEEFHRQLTQRINGLVGKIKNEAKSYDLRWIGEQILRYAIDNFETITETILEDYPSFYSLVVRLGNFIEANTRGEIEEQTQSSEGRIQKESDESQRVKDLMNFQKSLSRDIHSLLEQLRKIQNEELLENTQKIAIYLGNAEERIDDTFIKRIENLGDIVANIDRKQCNLRKIEQELDYNITLIKAFLKRVEESGGKVRTEKRKSDVEILRGENRKFKEACSSHLGDEYMRIERRMKDVEKQREGFRYRSFTSQMGRNIRERIPEDEENEPYQKKSIHQRETEETSEESLP